MVAKVADEVEVISTVVIASVCCEDSEDIHRWAEEWEDEQPTGG